MTIRQTLTIRILACLACAFAAITATASPAAASPPSPSTGCAAVPRLAAGQYTHEHWPISQVGTNRQTISRTFSVHVPRQHAQADGQPLPIVVNLHGTSETGASQNEESGMVEAGERYGFVVLAPNAWPWSTWTTSGHEVEDRQGFDDVEFVRKLLDVLHDKLCVDRNRVFVTGGSNGGIMAATLSRASTTDALGPHRIAAIAPVAAFPLPAGTQLSRSDPADKFGPDPFRGYVALGAELDGDAINCSILGPVPAVRPIEKAVPMQVFYGNEDKTIANGACYGSYLRSAQLRPLYRSIVHKALCGCNGQAQCPNRSGIEGQTATLVAFARCAVEYWARENGCVANTNAPVETGEAGWGVPFSRVAHDCSGVASQRGDTILTIVDVRDRSPTHPNTAEVPGGHIWPGGVKSGGTFKVTDEIWKFFEQHPR